MSKRIVCAFTLEEAEALAKHLHWVNSATNDTALFDVQCKVEQAVDQKPLEWSESGTFYSDTWRVLEAEFYGFELKVIESEDDSRWSWFFGEGSGFCLVEGTKKYDRIEDAKADAEAAVRMVVALFGKATK